MHWIHFNLLCALHALPASGADTYILGYGSLMKEWSRVKTKCGMDSLSAEAVQGLAEFAEFDETSTDCIELAKKQEIVPVNVTGVRRGWYAHGKLQGEVLDGLSLPQGWSLQALDVAPTYLGAVMDPESSCFAVIYPVDEDELALTDKREQMGTYKAQWIPASHVTMLAKGHSLSSDAKIRFYAQDESKVKKPNVQFPIVQSYVDIFIGGALELEDKWKVPGFAKNVAATTYGWNEHWVNDRVMPYRPFAEEAQSFRVTRTLLQAAQAAGSKLTMQHLGGIKFQEVPGLAATKLFLTDAPARPGHGANLQLLLAVPAAVLAVAALVWRLRAKPLPERGLDLGLE